MTAKPSGNTPQGCGEPLVESINKLLILLNMGNNSKNRKPSPPTDAFPITIFVKRKKTDIRVRQHGTGFDPKEIDIDDYRYSYDHSEYDHGCDSTGGNPADGD